MARPIAYLMLESECDFPPDSRSSLGTVYIELYRDRAPLAVQSFMGLCSADRLVAPSYIQCPLHRVIKGFLIASGDVVNGDGSGALDVFDDDLPLREVDRAGLFCTANLNDRPNSNTSQFFISMGTGAMNPIAASVVFGRVVGGMDVLRLIERMEVLPSSRPIWQVFIGDCGMLSDDDASSRDWVAVNCIDTRDTLPSYPEDNGPTVDAAARIDNSNRIRLVGNALFKENTMKTALLQYDKALRYLESDLLDSPEEAGMLLEARITCWLNQASVYIRLERASEAIACCDLALNHRPGCDKALQRRRAALKLIS